MNWISGLHYAGSALTAVGMVGVIAAFPAAFITAIEQEPVNWKRASLLAFTLTALLVGGAFITGVTA